MKAKSLSTFRTKLRLTDEGTVLVSTGQVIEGDNEHMRELARNRLVELLDDSDTDREAKPKGKTKADDEGDAKAAAETSVSTDVSKAKAKV